MILIPTTKEEAPEYLELVQCYLNATVHKFKPDEVYITYIDNWFSQRWLFFSGTSYGKITIASPRATIPPFYPKRVYYQKYFNWDSGKGKFISRRPKEKLHINQNSSNNHQRFIDRITQSAVLFWFSGNSHVNNRGCVMAYIIKVPEIRWAWYSSFNGRNEWRPEHSASIGHKELEELRVICGDIEPSFEIGAVRTIPSRKRPCA